MDKSRFKQCSNKLPHDDHKWTEVSELDMTGTNVINTGDTTIVGTIKTIPRECLGVGI